MQLYIEIKIYNKATLEEVAKKFSFYYPYLKLELDLLKQNLQSDGHPLFYILENGIINISDYIITQDLIDECAGLGLYAKVYRKAGNSWVEISLTRLWTLEHQNYEGEQITTQLLNERNVID